MAWLENMLSESVLNALGWTVLHSIWQAFLMALILGVVQFFLRNQTAWKRYLAAYFSLIGVVGLSLLTFSLLYSKEFNAPAELILYPEKEELPTVWQGWFSAFIQYCNTHIGAIVMVWMLGVLLFSIRFAGGLYAVQRFKHWHFSLPTSFWEKRLKELTLLIGVKSRVRIFESTKASVPMVIGWLKPVILFPIGALNHLDIDEVEAVLAHELAHIRQHDYLHNMLQSVIEILFYFNPAVWWISSQIRQERENCADDLAVAFCGNSLTYAKALYKLQEVQPTTPVLAMPLIRKNYRLLNRIHRILKPSPKKTDNMGRISALALLVAATLLFSFNTKNTAVAEDAIPFADSAMPKAVLTSWQELPSDTIPTNEKSEDIRHFLRSNGKEEIEVEMRNGEITELKIDGKKIPESEYSQYEDQINELMEEMPEPPAPPVPPVPPVAPMAPSAPMPPTPPMPPAPPMPRIHGNHFGNYSKQRKIVTKKTGKGETTIIVETGPGEEPVEIIVKEGKKGGVTINGQEIKGMKKGDQTIILNNPENIAFWEAFAYEHPKVWGDDDFYFSPEVFNFNTQEIEERAAQIEELMHERFGDLNEEWLQQRLNGAFDEDRLKQRMEEQQQRMEEWEALMRERMEQLQVREAERMRQQSDRIREMEQRQQEAAERIQKKLEAEQLEIEKAQQKVEKKGKNNKLSEM